MCATLCTFYSLLFQLIWPMNSKLTKKPKVLCAWEMGGDLGHLSHLSHITRGLVAHGYHCSVALKDLSRAAPFFEGDEVELFQAPVFLAKIAMQRPIVCLADSLLLSGYLKAEELCGILSAWQNLIRLVNPDIVILDYAPTAALAARDFPCRTISIGNGFADPVPGQPIRDWHPFQPQTELVQRQEARVVDTINQVMAIQGKNTVQFISDLYDTDRTLIMMPPEFDLYGETRTEGQYLCQKDHDLSLPSAKFGPAAGPKVLAYLKPAHPQLDLMLEGLANSPANVFVVCPQADPKKFKGLYGDSFRYSLELIQLMDAIAEADLFVGHGNAGSLIESLLVGVPVLALPIHLEQLLYGKTLEQLQLGKMIQRLESAHHLEDVLSDLLKDTHLKQRVGEYAADRQELTGQSLADYIVGECDEMVNPTKDVG